MSGLLLVAFALLPLLAAPAVQAPTPVASVEATNHALSQTLRCITRTQAQPFPECAALEQASAERVRFPAPKDPSSPTAWIQVMELRLNDGSWRRYEEMHRSVHGMLWVPEIGLYVGYAAWYGESGGTMMVDPETGDSVMVAGVPQLSPDRALMLAADVDPYNEVQRVQTFTVGGLPRKLSEQPLGVHADVLEQVVFVPERSTAVLYLQDTEGRSQAVSVDLSAHWPAKAADLLSVENCEKSENARYVTGDQVYLRTGPSKQAEVVSALPWGSCVQVQDTPGDWELVRMADQTGFVSAKLLVEAPPARGPKPPGLFSDSYCRAFVLPVAAGLEGYDLRPPYDACLAYPPLSDKPLGELERVDGPDLNMRFVMWTLALAPESAYRKHSGAALLNESPLFRAFPESHGPNRSVLIYNTALGEVSFAQLFGSAELRRTTEPPAKVHLLNVIPSGERLRFAAKDVDQDLGVSQGAFPAGQFQLSQDLSVARFDRDLPAAILDPCTGELIPTSVGDVAYELATGVLSGRVDSVLQERLQACMSSYPKEHYPQLRFVLLVDESEGAVALSAASGKAQERVVFEPTVYGTDARELRWSDLDGDNAFLRSASFPDCGIESVSVFQFLQDGVWHRVQSEVSDSSDCGT